MKHTTNRASRWTDERVEEILGKLLIAGVILAATFVLCGGARYLIHYGAGLPQYGVFHGEPADLRTLSGILKDAVALHGEGLIQLGIVLLVATPIARVAFSVFAFARQRDRLYVILTLIVLSLLLYSFVGGLNQP